MTKRGRYSPEVRERAIRMIFEHESDHGSQWETVTSIASKIGCTAETLRQWVRLAGESFYYYWEVEDRHKDRKVCG